MERLPCYHQNSRAESVSFEMERILFLIFYWEKLKHQTGFVVDMSLGHVTRLCFLISHSVLIFAFHS